MRAMVVDHCLTRRLRLVGFLKKISRELIGLAYRLASSKGRVGLWRIDNCQAWRVDLTIDQSEVDHFFKSVGFFFSKSVLFH